MFEWLKTNFVDIPLARLRSTKYTIVLLPAFVILQIIALVYARTVQNPSGLIVIFGPSFAVAGLSILLQWKHRNNPKYSIFWYFKAYKSNAKFIIFATIYAIIMLAYVLIRDNK